MVLFKHHLVNNVMIKTMMILICVLTPVCFAVVAMVLNNEQSSVIHDVSVMIEMVLHEQIVLQTHGFVLVIVNLVSVMAVLRLVMHDFVVTDFLMLIE